MWVAVFFDSEYCDFWFQVSHSFDLVSAIVDYDGTPWYAVYWLPACYDIEDAETALEDFVGEKLFDWVAMELSLLPPYIDDDDIPF